MDHQPHLRTRPIGVGQLRSFAAVARHLNFRAAADQLALTQSAVSRQIQSLEDEVGVPLFLRHTRAVELTSAGAQLLRAVTPALERIDGTVRQIRQTAGRKSVAITTWASFASMWLIPRLEEFQQAHPDIDIRIDASDQSGDLDTADVDIALRYALPANVPPTAQRLFGERLAVVASPWLLKGGTRLSQPEDVTQFALVEAGDAHRSAFMEHLSWRRWLARQGQEKLVPRRWLYFNYAHQMAQAVLAGQGISLARLPLVADSLARGDLVEAMPERRLDSPMAYWLLVGPRSAQRPEIRAFCDWLREQARITRERVGEGPDPDLADDIG
ncbi:LysR substrate-binding domain-containing protein [Xylophilus sp.]|uniref:LysR substrate-binding domain-containing protein n=1 Tax=Xylophilus sp. TaxID=2653893 RepID=UPI0013BD52A6|nr:LysR substrate-binding domain-containing protein [Xylophilus sp.]KAF1046434.1 MAG: Glycine cleavage system transcriptional activator [Xylophilus sp.]